MFKSEGLKSNIPQETLDETLRRLVRGNWYKLDSIAIRNILLDGANVNLLIETSFKKNILMHIFDDIYDKDYSSSLDVFFDFNIDLDSRDRNGRTILMYAAKEYTNRYNDSWAEDKPGNRKLRKDFIDRLLKNGADIHLKDSNNMTALTIANVEENDYASQVLIAAGAERDINAEWWYTLFRNSKKDQVARLQKLVDEGVDINIITEIPIFGTWSNKIRSGGTALIHSVRSGQFDLAKSLIAMKADPNIKDNEGKTAVHYISGITKDNGGQTVYSSSWARRYDSHSGKEMLEILIQGGADINIKDIYGKTLYDYCIESKQITLAKMVKEKMEVDNSVH